MIPQLNTPVYKVYFYHSTTGELMCYKFMIYEHALAFFDRLDQKTAKPTMSVLERIH
jgi:hypothetical protein